MVAKSKSIAVTDETDLPRLLDEAADAPLILERDGVRFRLSREDAADDPWAGYDPERVRAAVRAFAGSITADEGERMKALIYRGRAEGSRPPGRP